LALPFLLVFFVRFAGAQAKQEMLEEFASLAICNPL
jgi:hypothetical protein